jgi:hypothetical protein
MLLKAQSVSSPEAINAIKGFIDGMLVGEFLHQLPFNEFEKEVMSRFEKFQSSMEKLINP